MTKKILILAVELYRILISPYTPSSCVYRISCSRYAIRAINKYGILKGSLFTIFRLLTCHHFF